MDIEFHYYITYILARKGGFDTDKAGTIAYACQYTDDNNDKYAIACNDGTTYENYISQTLDIRHPKNKLIRIYTCFHFFPGDYQSDEARRSDCALHMFNTTPDSPKAKELFQAALDSDDLYRIGIATHCYSDTWAHQNFVGFKHAFGEQNGLLAKATPTIGHADFQHKPDIPNLEWKDPRLLCEKITIQNRQRFMLAARSIFAAFSRHNELDDVEGRWAELAEELDRAIGNDSSDVTKCEKGQASRIAAYIRICPDVPRYDAREWLSEATTPVANIVERWGDWLWRKVADLPVVGSIVAAYWFNCCRIRRFQATTEFFNSHWYHFQEAVLIHQKHAMQLHDDRYQQVGAAIKKIL